MCYPGAPTGSTKRCQSEFQMSVSMFLCSYRYLLLQSLSFVGLTLEQPLPWMHSSCTFGSQGPGGMKARGYYCDHSPADCNVTDSPGCPKPVCFASGSTRPEALKLQINRIKSALGVHRRRGRPEGSSKWDKEELYSVLKEYLRYGVFRREIKRHFSVG